MTRADTVKLLAIIITAYPASKVQDSPETIDLWHELLQDLPVEAAALATKSMISTNKFPPTIADIREAVAKAQAEARGEPSSGEALALVRKAMRLHGYYDATGARKMMGEDIWAVMRMVATCWEDLCASEDENWPARFERLYKEKAVKQHYREVVPVAVQDRMRAMVEETTRRLTGEQAMALLMSDE